MVDKTRALSHGLAIGLLVVASWWLHLKPLTAGLLVASGNLAVLALLEPKVERQRLVVWILSSLGAGVIVALWASR